MKLYQLTQGDLNTLFDKYRQLTNDTYFRTPSVDSVRDSLLHLSVFEQRQSLGDMPDSKLKIEKKMNGDLHVYFFPNRIRNSARVTAVEKSFNQFATSYLTARTKKGLP